MSADEITVFLDKVYERFPGLSQTVSVMVGNVESGKKMSGKVTSMTKKAGGSIIRFGLSDGTSFELNNTTYPAKWIISEGRGIVVSIRREK